MADNGAVVKRQGNNGRQHGGPPELQEDVGEDELRGRAHARIRGRVLLLIVFSGLKGEKLEEFENLTRVGPMQPIENNTEPAKISPVFELRRRFSWRTGTF